MLPDDSSRHDPFAPPIEPVEVFCLHCGNVYCSSEIKFVRSDDGQCQFKGQPGDWMCPAPGCDGIGFQFDIHPTATWCDDHHDEEEGYVADDEFADEAFSDFLSDSEEEEDVFLPADPQALEDEFELAADQDWLESRAYPYARRWRMWVHFRQWQMDSDLSPPSRGEYDQFNEDDIPF